MALLFVVGVLGLLAVVATALFHVTRAERIAAHRHLFGAKAMLLARSGLEETWARLDADQDPDDPSNRYAGEDWNGNGVLDGLEVGAQRYRVTAAGSHPDAESCPPAHALRPSFCLRGGFGGMPDLSAVQGRLRGKTGSLEPGADYATRVERGGIWVNGGDPATGPAVGYNATLRRMLGYLARAIEVESRGAYGLVEADGWALIDLRPSGGWESLEQIQRLAFPAAPLKADALRPYLACHAIPDLKVIRPHAPEGMESLHYESWERIKLAYPDRAGVRAPDFERSGGRVVGRAPVLFPWARRRVPVLTALFGNLGAVYLNEREAQVAGGGYGRGLDVVGVVERAAILLSWGADDVRRVIAHLTAYPHAIRDFSEWEAFCDSIALPQSHRDILKANFNPNSALNKFNPDRARARLVDKSDLLQYSTEWSFQPRTSVRCASVGRLLGPEGRILAERTLAVERAPDRTVTLTTQSEFVSEDLGRLDLVGDEGRPRQYGQVPFISESRGPVPTFGHRLALGGFLTGHSTGVALQTLPEPHRASPACWDGQICLSTLETRDGGWSDMTFLARWPERLDGDYSGGGGSLTAVRDVRHGPDDASLWDASSPGVIYPDGLYLEKGRQPGFHAAGNMHGQRGSLSYWMKPNYQVGVSDPMFRFHIHVNHTRVTPGYTACFLLGNMTQATSETTSEGFGFMWENALVQADQGKEKSTWTPMRVVEAHRWYLLTYFWDLRPPPPPQGDGNRGIRILVDRGQLPNDRNQPGTYALWNIDAPTVDFNQQLGGTSIFFLGRTGNDFTVLGLDGFAPPDATFDEFAVFDFMAGHNDNALGILRSETLAQERFVDGRYYKESRYEGLGHPMNTAAAYFSGPIPLGGAFLRRLSWTQIVPRGLKGPIGSSPEDGDSGPDGRILMELVDPSGTDYLRGSRGQPLVRESEHARGSPIRSRVESPFRLHAVFQPRLSRPEDTAILDPLVLDDVTVTYRGVDGSECLAWDLP